MMKFKFGNVIKDDLVNIETPFLVEEDFLTEDLFQLQYKDGLLGLDVGWYNKEFGDCFTISIIENFDWDTPLYSIDVFDKSLLRQSFLVALNIFYGYIEK